ncbi:MAG: DUF4214 domain-containing protein [Sulfitobacter sp.]
MVVETGTSANEFLDGSEFADTLDGAGGNDTIDGLDGADSLIGGFGADSIDGGAGNDTILGTTGLSADVETSAIGADTLIGGAGDDSINGFGNNTYAEGGIGNDSLYGGPGSSDDTLDGGTGADLMWGQGGADVYIVDNVGDSLGEFTYDTYGPGNTATGDVDEVRASISFVLPDWNNGDYNLENLTLTGSDSIDGTANEVGNVLNGNSGNNALNGLAGDDTIIGGLGNDTIDGGTGDDLMTGGSGADRFIINALSGDDTITDFVEGTDVLDLSAFSQSQIDVQDVSEDEDGNRVVSIGGASVTLLGASNTPDDDFLPGNTALLHGSLLDSVASFGRIEFAGDEDWFEASFVAGNQYQIEIRTDIGNLIDELDDPLLVGVYDNLGVFQPGSGDDNSGTGSNAETVFTATYTGLHYVAAQSADVLDQGFYQIEYVDLGPVVRQPLGANVTRFEDINEGANTTISIDYDLPDGILEFPGTGAPEELIAARSLNINTTTLGATLTEDYLFSYESGASHIIRLDALNDDVIEDDEAVTINVTGFIDWIVPLSGGPTVVNLLDEPIEGEIERGLIDISITYTINSAPEGDPISIADYTFTEPETVGNVLASFEDGVDESFAAVPFSFDNTIVGELLANGDLLITDATALPGQTVTVQFDVIDERGAITSSEQSIVFGALADDYLPGAASGLGTVSINGRTTGEIETSGDIDGFAVSLQADTTYEISILGSNSNNGSLMDPSLFGMFSTSDFNRTPITSVQTLNTQFVGDDSVSFFTPQTAGEYFIGVQDEFGGTGTYTVAVDNIGVRDDFAADINTTGSIMLGGSAVGSIDFAQDEDWFEVNLSANRLYEIELVPVEGASALSDPYFRGVYDSNGVLIQNTENDDVSGSDTSSKLQFVTDDAGTFNLAAGAFGDATGEYRLELNDLGPLDDNSFDITIEYTSNDVPNEYITAFEDAVERWEEVITGDLDYGYVEGHGFVDDILIEVSVQDIDLTFEGGEQTILAISSVLDQRSDAASGAGALPTHSRIVLNPDDIGPLLNLDELAQNTIGRALGFGSLWEEFGLVRDIDGVATYTGSNALREMQELSDDLNGQNVLEDGADGDLAAEYWDEDNLDNELMTPRVELRWPENGPAPAGRSDNPISELTIAAMQDLGYEVDYGAADAFSLPRGALSRIDITALLSGSSDQTDVARRMVSDLDNADDIPPGVTTIYSRANILSDTGIGAALTDANTALINATGTSALFFEGVTGDNLLIELTGTFDKSNLGALSDLSGAVTEMQVFSASGTLLLSIDYSRDPAEVGDLLASWPEVPGSNDDIIVVDALPGTVVRINPNGGTENDSRIFTGAGDDFVRGGDGAELINGGSQDDMLLGEGGDDILAGEAGNDTIDGGSGTDTALYSGNQNTYTLTLSADGTTLSDRSTGGNGTDQLSNVEFLNFDTNIFDGGFNLGIFGGPTSLSETQFESFIELYIAYFNRAPDAIGLNFWGTAFANGTSLEATASLFIDQDETRATYPSSLSNADFATAVYANVLGRVADQVGYDFWVGVLDDGSVGRDQFILAILGGAKAAPPDGATAEFITQQLADQAYLANKTDLGAYYAVHKGMSEVGNASAAMALFDGTQDSLNTAIAAIDGFHQAALSATTGEFLMPLVGVLDDPFA